ncbi:hypothetical protein [Succinatimonas hippei]|nr:hypothetical protein [Succinatimonas hippei]
MSSVTGDYRIFFYDNLMLLISSINKFFDLYGEGGRRNTCKNCGKEGT